MRVVQFLPLLLTAWVGLARGAEQPVCERSGSIQTTSPDEKWMARVQEVACVTANGAAAAVTVELHPVQDPSQAQRVFAMTVPRSRDDWPRVRWLSTSDLEVRIPNLAEAAPPKTDYQGIRISRIYCGDNPEDRARLAAYKEGVKQWQKDVSAWVKLRNQDAAAAGPRPPRPEEPRLPIGRCTD
jgi:hypothetical protein